MPSCEVQVHQMPAEALPEVLRAQKVVALLASPAVAGWDGPDLPGYRHVGALDMTSGPSGGSTFWFMRVLPPEGPRGGPLTRQEIIEATQRILNSIHQLGFAPARVWKTLAGRRGTYATGAVPAHGSPRTLLETTWVGRFAVKVFWDMDDITVQTAGFALRFPEKPNATSILVKHGSSASELLNRPDTMQTLTDLGERWRTQVHARIRQDWGERCFTPDAKGYYQHPLFEGARKRIHCVHCKRNFPAAAVATNLWHCPNTDCNGSPMEMQ